jgi:hypothetical protein
MTPRGMDLVLSRLSMAFVAFVCSEILSGSSPDWPRNPWTWLVTFPNCALHFFFLAGLAVRLRRFSLPALWGFGCLFGLYESWITKVVWHGFGPEGPAIGRVGEFAIYELVVLVLFWHPVVSFLLPLAILSSPESSFAEARKLFAGTRGRVLVAFLVLVSSVLLAHNGQPAPRVLLATAPAVLLLWAGHRALAKHDPERRGLVLGGAAFVLSGAGLIALYAVTYAKVHPEWLPTPATQAMTAVFYVVFAAFIAWKRAAPEPAPTPSQTPRRWLGAFLIVCVAAIALAVVSVPAPLLVAVLLAEIPASILVAVWMAKT